MILQKIQAEAILDGFGEIGGLKGDLEDCRGELRALLR